MRKRLYLQSTNKLISRHAITIGVFFLLLVAIIAGVVVQRLQKINRGLAAEAESKQLTSDFTDRLEFYQKSTASAVDKGLQDIARKRKVALLQVIDSNPQAVIDNILPMEVLSTMPKDLLPYVEEIKSVDGEYTRLITENEETGKSNEVYQLNTKELSYTLHFPGDLPQITPQSIVKVNGIYLDSDVVPFSYDGKEPTTTISSAAPAVTVGTMNIAFIMFNFTNDLRQPATKTFVESALLTAPDSAKPYYAEETFGKMTINSTIYGWITIPYTNANCSSMANTWANSADAIISATGVNLSHFQKKMYLFPPISGCPFSTAWANMSGPRAWINGVSATNFKHFLAHEFGHTIGMNHASSYDCYGKSIDYYSNCTDWAYGNRSDTMGYTPVHHHNTVASKVSMGWVPTGNVLAVTQSGAYTFGRNETQTSGYQVLKVSKPNTNQFYYLDYRRPVGFDYNLLAGIVEGANILIYSGVLGTKTWLIDTSPWTPPTRTGTGGDMPDAALVDNREFYDQINNIRIKQLCHTDTTVTVQVTLNNQLPPPYVCSGQYPFPIATRPALVPGTIQAENYDSGGEGIAYHDTTSGNAGGTYRTDSVDIEGTADTGGGYNVGWFAAGEWLEYTLSATQGVYDIEARVASNYSDPGDIRLTLNGVPLGTMVVSNTGGYQSWQTVRLIAVPISQGMNQVLRVELINGQYSNVNWIRFIPYIPPSPTPSPTPLQWPFPNASQPALIPGLLEAENFDEGSEGFAYHDTTSGNSGNQFRTKNVDIETTTDTGGGYNIGWYASGEWLEYTVNATAGTFTIEARIASAYSDPGDFQLSLNGVSLGRIVGFNTGGWQSWRTVTLSGARVNGGNNQVLRVDMANGTGQYTNFNWIRFIRTGP